MKKVLFEIGFQSLVLNYTYMLLFILKCLSNVINYIWFLNIILNHALFQIFFFFIFFLKKRALVIFFSVRPLVASGEKPKAFFPLNRNDAF